MAPERRDVAVSFGVTGLDPAPLARALDGVAKRLGSAAGALVFASGAAAAEPEPIVEAVRSALGNVPTLLAIGSGVRTEGVEHESAPAVSGLAWRVGRSALVSVPPRSDADDFAQALSSALGATKRARSVILFGTNDVLNARAVARIGAAGSSVRVVGAGCLPGGVVCLHADGLLARAPAAALVLSDMPSPLVAGASPCRLIGPLAPVTATQGAFVLSIDGRPALEALSAGGRAIRGQPLVLAVAADRSTDGDDEPPTVLVRGIRGIDPTRGAVLVSEDIEPGMLLGFGALDPNSARSELERVLRECSRKLAGAAPRFGLLLTCAGRGTGFYGGPNVEISLVRERFPGVPFAGMLAPFEVGPFGRTAAVHLHTAVIALFAAPS